MTSGRPISLLSPHLKIPHHYAWPLPCACTAEMQPKQMRIPAAMHPFSTTTQQILCYQPGVVLQPGGILLFMMDSYSTTDPISNLSCEGPQTQASHQGAAIHHLAYHALITLPTRPDACHKSKRHCDGTCRSLPLAFTISSLLIILPSILQQLVCSGDLPLFIAPIAVPTIVRSHMTV